MEMHDLGCCKDCTIMDEPCDRIGSIEEDLWLMMMDVEYEYLVNERLEYYPDDWSPTNIVINGRSEDISRSHNNNSAVSALFSLFLIDALLDEPPVSVDAQPFSPLMRRVYDEKDFHLNRNRNVSFIPTKSTKKNCKLMCKSSSVPCRQDVKWENGMPTAPPVTRDEYQAVPRLLPSSWSVDYTPAHPYPSHTDHNSDFLSEFLVVKLLADVENTFITPDGKVVVAATSAAHLSHETTLLPDSSQQPRMVENSSCSTSAKLATASPRQRKPKTADVQIPHKQKRKWSKATTVRTNEMSSIVKVTVKSRTTGNFNIRQIPIAKKCPATFRNSNLKNKTAKLVVGTTSINVKESHRAVKHFKTNVDCSYLPPTSTATKQLVKVTGIRNGKSQAYTPPLKPVLHNVTNTA